jgi:hypothetical protein
MILPWLLLFSVKVHFVSFSSPVRNRGGISMLHTDGEAKFWLEPEEEVLHAWNSHFGN